MNRWGLRGLVAITLTAAAAAASAKVIYVKHDATGANNGTSWQDAFVYLQDALAARQLWDEIWVAAGTYTPDMGGGKTPGDRDASFSRDGVYVYGGFAGTETIKEQRDWVTNATTLSGDLLANDGPDFTNRDDNSRHVIRFGTETHFTLFDGFEIRGGYASDTTSQEGQHGGGILLWNSTPNVYYVYNCTFVDNWAHYGGAIGGQSSADVDGCAFLENRAQVEGGGLLMVGGFVQASRFERNHATHTGGASIRGGSVNLCTFVENDGGGLELLYGDQGVQLCDFIRNGGTGLRISSMSRAYVRDCRFIGNTQGGLRVQSVSEVYVAQSLFSGNGGVDGAAIFAEDFPLHPEWQWTNFRVASCSLSENTATGRGGGVFLAQTNETAELHPQIVNCILWDNRDASGEGEAAQVYNATPALITPSMRYSCISSGWSGEGTGNIAVDPLFVDYEGPDGIVGTPDDDLHLRADSPAIDAGDNLSAAEWDFFLYGDSDIENNIRFEDVVEIADTGAGGAYCTPIIDMGPYERPGRTVYLSHRSIDLEPWGYPPVYVPEGGIAEFVVSLNFDPGQPLTLTVTVVSGDSDISVVSGAELTFDSSNWYDAQWVTLSAAQDADIVPGMAALDVTGPGLSHYLVQAVEVEDEYQELVIGNAPLYVPEGGEAAFTVALAFDPGGPFTLEYEYFADDPDLQLRDPISPLVFDSSNYSVPQSIWLTDLQDADADSGHAYVYLHAPAYTVDAYVDVYEVDDDRFLVITGAPVSVPEGGSGTFYVRPEGEFTGTLVVTTAWESGDADISVTAGQTLEFTYGYDSGTPKPVTLTAAQDADELNGTATFSVTADGWTGAQVTANEVDDDHALIVGPTAVSVPEGSMATFDVHLAAAPGSTVTVDTVWVSGDTDISVSGGASLMFDDTNYDQPQTVTLAAAQDADHADGVATLLVRCATYPDVTVTATEIDDDAPPAIFVRASAPAGGDGTSWQTAFRYLQDALAVAQASDQIWVAVGTYKPDQGAGQTSGNRNATFALRTGVSLYGGFDGTEATPAQRAGLFEQTMLSGDLLGNDAPNFTNYGDNSYNVVTATNVSGGAVLDGVTIMAGYGPGGAGLLSTGSTLQISHCYFLRNRTTGTAYGGAIRMVSSTLQVGETTFQGNKAYDSGAVELVNSTAAFSRCLFLGNMARYGGAIAATGGGSGNTGQFTFTNCLFSGNKAYENPDSYGGVAFFWWSGTAQFTNCTFHGSTAVVGGALHTRTGTTQVANCIFWGNTAVQSYADIYGPTTVAYSDVVWPGTGNMSADPQFVDPDGADGIIGTADDDLRLAGTSPCIDAADNTAVPPGITTDLDGNPRFHDAPATPDTGNGSPPIVDMGPYEFGGQQHWIIAPSAVEVPEGGTTDFQVRLADAPPAPVTVATSWLSGDADISVVAGAALVFDDTNYDQPQTVTLAAAQDADAIRGVATLRIEAATYPAVALTATEADDDEPVPGDCNCDGAFDSYDIHPFVLALTDDDAYRAMYPECDLALADLDGNGAVDSFDIAPFLDQLTNGG